MRIVITGPESSGKTTLANALASYSHLPLVPEMSRLFLNERKGEYRSSDLLHIGQIQYNEEQKRNKSHCICDTDLLTILVWANFKYGNVDPWISQKLGDLTGRFYILCKPDIPWEPDPLRENPNDRDELFDIYRHELEKRQAPYIIVGGSHEHRMERSCSVLEKLIA